MLPEEKARVKIDKQLRNAGWDIVARNEYLPNSTYGSHIVEAHHIDYFVSSLNNDASNQLIVCPNHHSIIHDTNPIFDRQRLIYIYKNGLEQRLVLNQHL